MSVLLNNKLKKNSLFKKIEFLEKLLKEKKSFYIAIKEYSELYREDKTLLFKVTLDTKYIVIKKQGYIKICFFIKDKKLTCLDNFNTQKWNIIYT